MNGYGITLIFYNMTQQFMGYCPVIRTQSYESMLLLKKKLGIGYELTNKLTMIETVTISDMSDALVNVLIQLSVTGGKSGNIEEMVAKYYDKIIRRIKTKTFAW